MDFQDDDQLSVYKISSGHTVHMVKGQARQQPAASTSSTAQPLPTMQAGQNIHDPLTQLNSHLGFGAMAGINPFADLGVNPNDPNMVRQASHSSFSGPDLMFQMTSLMNDPRVLEQMAQSMSNPAVIDSIIAMNPQLANMAPQMRQMFQSEEFRQIM
jgi:ubiquilin